MTKEQAIEILANEKMCVQRDCDRNCGACELAREETEIVDAFDTAISALMEGGAIPGIHRLTPDALSLIKYMPEAVNALADKLIEKFDKIILEGEP